MPEGYRQLCDVFQYAINKYFMGGPLIHKLQKEILSAFECQLKNILVRKLLLKRRLMADNDF